MKLSWISTLLALGLGACSAPAAPTDEGEPPSCATCEDGDAGTTDDAFPPPADSRTMMEDAALAEADDAGSSSDGGATGPAPCALGSDAPLVLLYASVGGDDNLRFLHDDCSAEVVVGEKREAGPRSAMKHPEARALGGRSGYIMDLHGTRIRDALRRTDGVARTAAELEAILDNGYDYIIIDEITTAADWVDGALVNRRFRRLLEVLPPRKVIAYVSLDLTMSPSGDTAMAARRQLLYALMQHGRAIALEVYLHTGQVIAGQAPDLLRRAAIRLRHATLGLPDGGHVNRRAITVLGLSIHEPAPYNYLDRPHDDLRAVRIQARAVRDFGALLQEQRGLGYYYVTHSDIVPYASAPYDFDRLVDVVTEEAHLTALAAE